MNHHQIAHRIIAQLDTLTEHERERILCELLNHFCVACGRKGDWKETTCDCEPEAYKAQPPTTPEPIQLWMPYLKTG